MNIRFQTPARPRFEYDTEYSNTYLKLKGQSRSKSNFRSNSRLVNNAQLSFAGHRRDITPAEDQIRSLPVVPKKGVANEWAAMAKLNDEKDQERDRREKEQMKSKQIEYRAELQNQIKLQQSRSKSTMDSYIAEQHQRQNRNEMFEKYGFELNKAKKGTECSTVFHKKQKEALIVAESMKELQKRNQENKVIKQIENNEFK